MKNYISEVIVQVYTFECVVLFSVYNWRAMLNSFVNDFSLQLSGNEASFRSERLYVNKLNVILVQVSAALPDNMQCIFLVAVSLFGFCTC